MLIPGQTHDARGHSHALPTGIVTVMFTDIEGSTLLWERLRGDFAAAHEHHDLLLRQAITDHTGHVVKTEGDAFMAAFSRPTGAVRCAVHIQRTVAQITVPPDGERLGSG